MVKVFLCPLWRLQIPKGKVVVLLGAGGAARAIAVELALAGAAKFYVVNRGQSRGEELTKLINEKTKAKPEFVEWSSTFDIPTDADVLINATSMGMAGATELQDINYSSIRKGMLVADVIVNPPHTPFLQKAEEQGAITLQGLGMVVNQAVISIKYWTGKDVDPTALRDELIRVL